MLLNTHTYYSLRYGTISIENLVQSAKEAGFNSLALTDINATTGVYDFILECLDYDIKPIIGIDFRTKNDQHFVALAKNQEGFREMNELQSHCNKEDKLLPATPPDWNDCFVIYPLQKSPKILRDFEYIGVRHNELHMLRTSKWHKHQDRVVILHTVTFQSKQHFNLHVILRAVDTNVLVSKLQKVDVASREEYMVDLQTLLQRFEHFPEIIKTTKRIIDQCNFTFDFTSPKNKTTFTSSRWNDKTLLTKLAYEGMDRRYGKHNKEAKWKIHKEIEIIDQMGFSGYFLITWDVVKYSMSRGFFHVGRGSGANSIVSYCLNITDVCPIDQNLYFERFLNPSRLKAPDFDIDWSWKDRDEILDYLFTRFDGDRVAFCGVTGSFKHRSIFRELGKAYGLSKEELDELSQTPMHGQQSNKVVKRIQHYGQLLAGFPNQRSLHACGILISEKPLTYYTILDMPPKNFQTAQFNMYIAEEIGFDKLDILSQRGLGHISETLDIVRQNRDKEIPIHNVQDFKYDEKINHRLATGKTLGCFYIESPAMRGLLRRLKCDNYQTLVAASSVIRPGVAKSGMMSEYVYRHNNPDKFEYFHPIFEEQLKETYGVMVYQEDVIKIAHHFADLDFADADILRRAMTGKTRSKKEFERVKEKYFKNCKAKGYPDTLTNEVYRQIESFAGFSFCKAHSASYSVESYQSLYLKTYFPIEFMTAVINNSGGFYRREVYIHEARMAGAAVHCPCINRSSVLAAVYGKDVYLGLGHIKSLPSDVIEALIIDRTQNGAFKNLHNFIERVPMGIESLEFLIFAGALRFTKIPKSCLVLEGRMLLSDTPKIKNLKLFDTEAPVFKLPEIPRNSFEDAFDELELLSFPVSCSPFDLLRTDYRGHVMVKDLPKYHKKIVRMVGYLISRKNVPTKQGDMNFGTWIDVEGAYFDTTHFNKCLRKYPFQGGGCYLLEGRVEIDFSFPSVEITRMARLAFMPDPRYADTEDKKFDWERHYKEDYSGTNRDPYPDPQVIGMPRYKMDERAIPKGGGTSLQVSEPR